MTSALILKNESLNKYNSWRVGGTADALYTPKDLEDLKMFLKNENYLKPLTFIGLGSNILVRDGGIRGTVIVMHAALNNIQFIDKALFDGINQSISEKAVRPRFLSYKDHNNIFKNLRYFSLLFFFPKKFISY